MNIAKDGFVSILKFSCLLRCGLGIRKKTQTKLRYSGFIVVGCWALGSYGDWRTKGKRIAVQWERLFWMNEEIMWLWNADLVVTHLVTNYWFGPESINDEINRKKIHSSLYRDECRIVDGDGSNFFLSFLFCGVLNEVRWTMCRTHRDLDNTKDEKEFQNFLRHVLLTTPRTIDGELC